jgi:hypothetical protein
VKITDKELRSRADGEPGHPHGIECRANALELLALRSESRRLRKALKEIRLRANVGGAIKDIADKALHPVPKKRGMR